MKLSSNRGLYSAVGTNETIALRFVMAFDAPSGSSTRSIRSSTLV